jgi:hypothetical protein
MILGEWLLAAGEERFDAGLEGQDLFLFITAHAKISLLEFS